MNIIGKNAKKIFEIMWNAPHKRMMRKYNFDAQRVAEECILWTRNYVNSISPNMKVVIGISGGKDSSAVAAILKYAIGEDRIVAVQLPCGVQKDLDDSDKVIKELGLKAYNINIGKAYDALSMNVVKALGKDTLPDTFTTNTPARLRMTTLYGVAAVVGGLVVNTCNRSEDIVGYSTKFGDHAGDFAPINHLTTDEVIMIGEELGVPQELMRKTPADGMSLNDDGSLKSDESKLGMKYSEINWFIRNGKKDVNKDQLKALAFEKIMKLFKASKHKFDLHLPHFDPKLPDYFEKEYGL